jgi:hypothetical protein
VDVYITKGTRVRVVLMTAQPIGDWSLAGMQMKLPVTREEFCGIVRHVWADDPQGTKNVRVQVELDDKSLRETPISTIVEILSP